MNVNRFINVREGNALTAVRAFLAAWWQRYQLEALLAPVEAPTRTTVTMEMMDDPAKIAAINPFAPVMPANAAALIGDFARRYLGRRAAALLRPCELRTLTELWQHRRLPPEAEALTMVSTDCLGTFPVEAYARRVALHGAPAVTQEALAYAEQGGFSPQDFRPACQVCVDPAPHGADFVIGVIGADPAHYLLIIARDEMTDARLRLEAVTDGLATEPHATGRGFAIASIIEQRAHTRAHLQEAQHAQPFSDLGLVLNWFSNCSLCGDCLDACPMYNGELSGALGVHGARPMLAELVDVSRWLASCSGCGMCEAACPQDVPLMALVTSLSHQIQDARHHVAGEPAWPRAWSQVEVSSK